MPHFLSEEWVEAFNAAIADVEVSAFLPPDALATANSRYRVEQLIHGVPPGDSVVRTILIVEGDSVRLTLGEPSDEVEASEASVVISLDYADAVAMSKGELTPPQALATGRVRVRGDLSLLITGQGLLTAMSERLGALQQATTY